MDKTPSARCCECRAEVMVPDSYADGDQIKCRTCGTPLKVRRGDVLRLVLADVAPLRDTIRANQQAVERKQGDLQKARGSLGIGVNGLGLGLIFILWQIVLKERTLDGRLVALAITIALVSGGLLEVANYFFLAKHREMTRLAEEIEELRREGRDLRQKLRDAGKP